MSELPVVVLFGGLPGAGKSTVSKALKEKLGAAARLIVSERYREELGLQDPFNQQYRALLQRRLADEIRTSLADGVRWTILDSNLLEAEARRTMVRAGGEQARYVFIGPHAPLTTLRPRVEAKFGVRYMYPSQRFSADDVIDHSLSAGEPITTAEALDLFDAVVQVMTDTGTIRVWGQGKTARSPLGQLIEFLDAGQRGVVAAAPAPTAELGLLTPEDAWMWEPEADGLIGRAPERSVTYHRRRTLGTRETDHAKSDALGLLDFAGSYVGTLRRLVGPVQLLIPSVRIVLRDKRGRLLLVRRRDTEEWRLVGGSQELDESIVEAARRELLEETGLVVDRLDLVSIRTGVEQVGVDHFGNCNHGLVFTFQAAHRGGKLLTRTSETIDAGWFALDRLPHLPERHRVSLDDARNFDGTPVVT